MNKTIVAVGGGGYNIAAKVMKSNLFTDAQSLVCDTDRTALSERKDHADQQFLLERNSVKDLLAQTGDTIILCVALGGRAGSAYAPMIAQEARQAGKYVCSLFAMPWGFEGEERNRTATTARDELLLVSRFAIQQNNDRFRAEGKKCTMRDFMEKADQGLLDVLKVLSSRALEDWAMEPDHEKLQALIPEQYRLPGEPYIELYANGYSALKE